MKKGILVAKRKTQDKENKDVIWLTIYECPRYYTDKQSGQKKLFYNKKENSILVACISKEQNPVNYNVFENCLEGALVGVNFGFNEYTNNSFISSVDLISPSKFTTQQLYENTK